MHAVYCIHECLGYVNKSFVEGVMSDFVTDHQTRQKTDPPKIRRFPWQPGSVASLDWCPGSAPLKMMMLMVIKLTNELNDFTL